MNELLNIIEEHKDKNNQTICNDLINIIKSLNITSVEQLKEYENKLFYTDNLKDRIEQKYYEYQTDITHLDYSDTYDLSKIEYYEEKIENEKEEYIRCKYLILLFATIEWDLFFPYEAFILIQKDLLN